MKKSYKGKGDGIFEVSQNIIYETYCLNNKMLFKQYDSCHVHHEKNSQNYAMKMSKIGFVILQVVFLLLIISCSSSEDSNEKGVIKETQEKIVQDATSSIKAPLDQAKTAAKLADKHTRQVEETQQQ